MNYRKLQLHKVNFLIGMLFFLMVSQGCAIKLVADYDAELSNEIVNVSKQVDKFYGELLETTYSDRSYETFKDRYIAIEVNIRALVLQNKARPVNEESISIAKTTLEKWLKYKEKHKDNWTNYQLTEGEANKIEAKDIYKDTLAKNHRKRFTRLFTAMSVAEEAKKMKSEEANDKEEDK